MAKQKLDQWQIEDAARLKAIFNRKKKLLGLTQEKLALAIGTNQQSGASNYINGYTALNIKVSLIFARELDCKIEEFSPTLAELIAKSKGGPIEDVDNELIEIAGEISADSQKFLISVARTLRDEERARKRK